MFFCSEPSNAAIQHVWQAIIRNPDALAGPQCRFGSDWTAKNEVYRLKWHESTETVSFTLNVIIINHPRRPFSAPWSVKIISFHRCMSNNNMPLRQTASLIGDDQYQLIVSAGLCSVFTITYLWGSLFQTIHNLSTCPRAASLLIINKSIDQVSPINYQGINSRWDLLKQPQMLKSLCKNLHVSQRMFEYEVGQNVSRLH